MPGGKDACLVGRTDACLVGRALHWGRDRMETEVSEGHKQVDGFGFSSPFESQQEQRHWV